MRGMGRRYEEQAIVKTYFKACRSHRQCVTLPQVASSSPFRATLFECRATVGPASLSINVVGFRDSFDR